MNVARKTSAMALIELPVQQPRCERVTKQVNALSAGPLVQARSTKGFAENGRQVVLGCERLVWGEVPHENVAELCRGSARAEVVDESLLHIRQQGEGQQPACLGLREGDLPATPVDVIEAELPNITVKWTPKTGQSNKLLLAVQERGKHAKETEVPHGGGEGPGGVGGGQGRQDGQ